MSIHSSRSTSFYCFGSSYYFFYASPSFDDYSGLIFINLTLTILEMAFLCSTSSAFLLIIMTFSLSYCLFLSFSVASYEDTTSSPSIFGSGREFNTMLKSVHIIFLCSALFMLTPLLSSTLKSSVICSLSSWIFVYLFFMKLIASSSIFALASSNSLKWSSETGS